MLSERSATALALTLIGFSGLIAGLQEGLSGVVMAAVTGVSSPNFLRSKSIRQGNEW